MTDQVTSPLIPRPPCANCGHGHRDHYSQGGETGCAHRVYSRLVSGQVTNFRECECLRYEPKSYDVEPAQPDRPQQEPRPSTGDIQLLVIEDMQARRQFGIEKYGTPLQANNGRDALMDAYQEALDLVMYLKQAIEERDHA